MATPFTMTESLKSLARRIELTTAGGRRYKISSGAEFDALKRLDREELGEFAVVARANVVSRMGGTVFEFTRSGASYAV